MALTVIKPSGIDTSGNYTVTGMNVSANISVANLSATTSANLGNVGNITITGGSSGQVLSTNGSGGLSFISVSSSGISNGNSNVNIATANGNVTITSAGNTTMTITGTGANVSGTLSISGNSNLGNSAVANYFTGNLYGTANLATYATTANSVAGANVSGQVSNSLVAGTVYTNAQPNITSIGTLTSLSVSGNATIGGNLITSGAGGGNITGANVVSANLFTGTLTTQSQPNITSVGTLTSISVSGNANVGNIGTTNLVATGTGSFGANVNMNTYWINNVGYPNLTTDVATKAYVDTMISSGIAYHQPVNVATTTTLAIATSGTTSYVSPNGAANGIGAYISTTGTYLNIDSANVQTVGTRILVKDEANATWNGVYTYANTTAIIRSTDTDEYGPDSTAQLSINDYFFTQGGTVNKGVAFIVSAPTGTITFGTSNITFAQFSTSQVYTAGTGIAITGTVISANASQTQVTAVGTLTTLSVSGNANIGNIGATSGIFTNVSGNGSTLSSITGGNVTGQVGNALVAGTVYTNAQPNITSVGTLTTLSVSGNATVGNIIASSGGGGGNITGANLVSANFFTGTLTTAAQPNITSTGTLASLSVTGNANIGNIGTGGLITATGNLNAGNIITGGIVSATGNGSFGNVNGGNLITANYTTAVITTGAQPNITSIGTLTSLSVSGTSNLGAVGNVTITGGTNGYVLSTNGSGTLSWVAQSSGGGASISNGTSNVNIATSGGNVTTSVNGNANILVVTGTGANVNGTLKVTGQSNLGAVANVVITGGTANYALTTDGAGNLSWAAMPGGANVTVDNFTGNGVQTIFTLSTTPIGINQTSVNYNGATVLRTGYTLANANITFSSAPANGSLIEVTTINLTSGGSSAAAVGYSLIFGG